MPFLGLPGGRGGGFQGVVLGGSGAVFWQRAVQARSQSPPSPPCRSPPPFDLVPVFQVFQVILSPMAFGRPQALSELQERNRHRPLQAAFNSPSISSNGKLDDGR